MGEFVFLLLVLVGLAGLGLGIAAGATLSALLDRPVRRPVVAPVFPEESDSGWEQLPLDDPYLAAKTP